MPLLGVLPGTGGLTRLIDKRKVRRDLADVFCTLAEGVRGQRAKEWRLVDELRQAAAVRRDGEARAPLELAAQSDRPADAHGVTLDAARAHDRRRRLSLRARRRARSTARARTATHHRVARPDGAQPADIAGIIAAGAAWWPLAMARELDDAILLLRTNELEIGTWLLKTARRRRARARGRRGARTRTARTGSCARRSACCGARCARLDVTSRTLFALIEPGSCFAGTLLELALAADRSYMLDCRRTMPRRRDRAVAR